jgi:hypothetical protein
MVLGESIFMLEMHMMSLLNLNIGMYPEITISCNTHGQGNENEYKLLPYDLDVWVKETAQTTYIDTTSTPTTTKDYSIDPIILQRSTYKYSNIIDYYNDWKTQLVEDCKTTLPVEIEGLEPTQDLTVSILEDTGSTKEISDDEAIELDHLGLYKFYVKSDNKFRVSLNNNNEGIYFFDIDKNIIKENILMLEEGTFDSVIGREICIAYLGKEENSFKVDEQTLKTEIYFTDLVKNESINVKLHRKYFNSSTIANLDTDIKSLVAGTSRLFLGENDIETSYQYTSNLETEVSYEKIERDSTGTITKKDETINLNYGLYNVKTEYIRNRETESFLSRGYVNHDTTLDVSTITSSTTEYPLSLIGRLKIQNPGNFNNQALTTDIYKIIPIQLVVVDKTIIELPYNASRSKKFSIDIPENGEIVVEATSISKVGDKNEYIYEEVPEYSTTSSGILDLEDYKIQRYPDGDTDGKMSYLVIGPDSEFKEDLSKMIGYIRVKKFVSKDNFILGENGAPITDYTQDEVNDLVGYSTVTINVKRLSLSDSSSYFEGDFATLISKDGETRNFNVVTLNNSSEVTNALTDDEKKYISNLKITNNANSNISTVEATYKSRLLRFGYSPISVLATKGVLTTSCCNNIYKFSSRLEGESNFTVGVTNVGISNETLTTSGIKQEVWSNGLRFSASSYSSGSVYLGSNNMYSISVDYTGTTLLLSLDSVILPISGETKFTSNGQPIIQWYSAGITVGNWTMRAGFDYSASNYPTYTISVNVPENSGTTTNYYYIKFVDATGENTLTLSISSNPNTSYTVIPISSYKFVEGSTTELESIEELKELVISSNNRKATYPSIINSTFSNSIFVLTDSLTLGAVCRDFSLSYTNISIGESEDTPNIIGCTMDNSVIATLKGSNITYSGKTYNLYLIEPYIDITNITYNSNSDINGNLGRVPYTLHNCRIYINNSNISTTSPNTFNIRHGVCNITLNGPYKTYLGMRLWDDDDEDIFEAQKYVDFAEPDSTETSKLVGSYLISNMTPSTENYYVGSNISTNDEITINYFDTATEPKYLNDYFEYIGYYAGFYFKVERSEWLIDQLGNPYVETLNKFSLQYSSYPVIVKPMGYSAIYYTDDKEAVEDIENHVRSAGNPNQLALTYYENISSYTNSTYYSIKGGILTVSDYEKFDKDISNSLGIGILFDIPYSNFSLKNNTYSVDRDITLSIPNESAVSSSTKYYDEVTFTFNINLNK